MRLWSAAEDARLRLAFPSMRTVIVARDLGRGVSAVSSRAKKLGVTKSETYLASAEACRLNGREAGWQIDAHSLGFYVRRFGWSDLVKPLTGAEEASAPAAGRWDELKASVAHDVLACHRLAAAMGVI